MIISRYTGVLFFKAPAPHPDRGGKRILWVINMPSNYTKKIKSKQLFLCKVRGVKPKVEGITGRSGSMRAIAECGPTFGVNP